MLRIPLDKATRKQLHEVITTQLGIDMPWKDNIPMQSLQATLNKVGYSKPYIEIQGDENPDETLEGGRPEPVDQPEVPRLPDREYVTVNIARASEGSDDLVPLTVNGTTMVVRRGIDSRIPIEYWEILKNAKQTLFIPNPDGAIIEREVQTHPFSLVSKG